MKYEWKKQEKELYLPKNKPELVTIPKFKFFTLSGQGNPNNNEEFSEAIEALYSLSYTIRMLPKKGIVPEGYFEYTVYPLEGVWDLAEEARGKDKLDKDSLIYKIMIRQPEFVTEELAENIIEQVKVKKSNELLNKVKFESIEEGLCVQMMHFGSYDDEKESFDKMQDYCNKNNLTRLSMIHKEIYISDPRKTEKEKLKTVLRFNVAELSR
ncbi:GyrI-like domain-containing protein [Sedimentibacter sp.]|uniref:GyrI-like domain-containing protein n=1 Tax=Sedimentibacter sp. TaxID=1960295 RepID=UPI0028ABEC9B|nr:GyrI-like domain-containing protein [Sedimentibacter sp.]